jgi:hypothetical protein
MDENEAKTLILLIWNDKPARTSILVIVILCLLLSVLFRFVHCLFKDKIWKQKSEHATDLYAWKPSSFLFQFPLWSCCVISLHWRFHNLSFRVQVSWYLYGLSTVCCYVEMKVSKQILIQPRASIHSDLFYITDIDLSFQIFFHY